MYVCMYTAGMPTAHEEGVRSPGTRVTDDFDPSCGCWNQSSYSGKSRIAPKH